VVLRLAKVRHSSIEGAREDVADSIALCRPLYHDFPEKEEAYLFPNAYFFGSELLVPPFTTPINPKTRVSQQVVWLPDISKNDKGESEDWFLLDTKSLIDTESKLLGMFSVQNQPIRYKAGCCHALYGTISQVPVFAKPGAIIPLAAPTTRMQNFPPHLDVHVFPEKKIRLGSMKMMVSALRISEVFVRKHILR